MKQPFNFYKDRMSWLSEIQIFRKRLENIKSEVKEIDISNGNLEDAETRSFSDSANSIDREFDITERKLLFSLNNGVTYWTDAYHNTSERPGNRHDENDLFERMKSSYTRLIELQRSINDYLQKTMVVK